MRCVKMSKKILVVGGGGREHAIIKALKKSPDCGEVWCAPGNGGIGYENAAKAARLAFDKNLSLKEAVLQLKLLTEEEFDRQVRPEKMI